MTFLHEVPGSTCSEVGSDDAIKAELGSQ